jgi:hypothetical protein
MAVLDKDMTICILSDSQDDVIDCDTVKHLTENGTFMRMFGDAWVGEVSIEEGNLVVVVR